MPPRNTGGFSRYVNPRAHYAGTPLESDWEKLQRRRAINDAITRQSMAPYQGTEMVSGRAVDDRLGQGIGKIGQAIVGAMGNKDWNEKADSLNEQYDTGRKEAMGKVTEALREQGNSGEYGPQIPKKADHMKAAMGLLDPYLKHGDISRALINSQAYSNRKSGSPAYQFLPTTEGYARGNRFTGDMEVAPGNFTRPHDDPNLQYDLSGAKRNASNRSDLGYKPDIASGVRQAEKDVDLTMNPEIKEATDLAARDAEKIINKPKIEGTLSAAETKTGMLGGLIDKAKEQSGIWTTGFLGGATSWVYGTPAHDLSSTLSTIKANIGFDKLQEMRNNSPTGGALGQVSEFENKLLQDVWGALSQSQSPTQFKENLDLVNKQVEESWIRIKEAYKKDYGTEYSGGSAPEKPISEMTDEEIRTELKK